MPLFIGDIPSIKVRDFSGLSGEYGYESLSEQDASQADNIEFWAGNPGTRRGFEQHLTLSGTNSPTWMRNWIGADYNRLLTYSKADRQLRLKLQTGALTESLLKTFAAGETIDCALDGTFAYVAPYSIDATSGLPDGAADPVAVCPDPATPGSLVVDNLWPADPGASSITGASATFVTPGGANTPMTNRKIIFIWYTRSGFLCKPILPGQVGEYPLTFTTVNGLYLIQFQIPSGLDQQYRGCYIAMNTAANPSQFFILPQRYDRVYPTGPTFGFVLDLSDASIAQYEDATNLTFEFTQGSPYTIRPHAITPYKDRMAYLANVPNSVNASGTKQTAVFVSDAGTPQNIAIDRSLISLPDAKVACAHRQVKDVLAIFGPGYTYGVYATADDPVNWATPQLIDGAVGANRPDCVFSSSKGYLWVASTSGAYQFDGHSYSALSMNYKQLDIWRRINWKAPANAIQIDEDIDNHQLIIRVPLDAATEPTHLLVWNYYNDEREMRSSIWTLPSWATSASCILIDPATNQKRYAVGYSSGGTRAVWKQRLFDSTLADLFKDGSDLVAFNYAHAPLPGPGDNRAGVKTHKLVQIRLTLQGSLQVYMQDLNRTRTRTYNTYTGSNDENTKTISQYIDIQSPAAVIGVQGTGGFRILELNLFSQNWIVKGGLDMLTGT